MSRKEIVVLTGAGISAESGISTFRDSNGLWENHSIEEVATPEAWIKNKELVLRFYNLRRQQLKTVEPNAAHFALAQLEKDHDVFVITQNVDDLHERAGSSNIVHLHGELLKVRSEQYPKDIIHWTEDVQLGDLCANGYQLRPHIVWFGESVPMLDTAIDIIQDADVVMIIGTSMQVYPAAQLYQYAPQEAKIYYIDAFPADVDTKKIQVIPQKATVGVVALVNQFMTV